MRFVSLVVLLVLSACGGVYSSADMGPQTANVPGSGNDATRDGFYDGGVFDPDLTRRDIQVPE